jgi:hypothetical protein
MRKTLLVAQLVMIPLLAGGCASLSRPNPTERPDLVVPPPPPHVVPITPEPVIEPVAEIPGSSTPAATAARPPARPPAPRPAATEARADKPGTEAKPDAAPPEPPPVTPPPAPAPQLRTAESVAAESTVRASIDRAKNLLANIDYRRLTTVRKKAYDDAKQFVQQAEDALKTGNAVFAQGVATKAETLAKELAGR